MTKTFVTIAAVAMLSTAALADDFGNTNLSMAVESTDYGIELSANETHRSFEVHTNNQPLAQSVEIYSKAWIGIQGKIILYSEEIL